MENDKKYSGFYKDFLDGNLHLISSGKVFNHSRCMFCEFNDIITPTWYAIIDNILKTQPKELEEFLDLSLLETLSTEDRIRWYATRKNRNALLDIKKEGILDDDINRITNDLFDSRFAYYNEKDDPYLMNFAYTLVKATRTASTIVDKFIIYVEQCNKYVDEFLTSIYGSKVEIRSGNLIGALSDVSFDSTFVFSDIYKINALIKTDKLKGSSVLLADGYGYNYNGKPGFNENLMIDVDALSESIGFNFNLFNNFTE